jgi:hypothetical protein
VSPIDVAPEPVRVAPKSRHAAKKIHKKSAAVRKRRKRLSQTLRFAAWPSFYVGVAIGGHKHARDVFFHRGVAARALKVPCLLWALPLKWPWPRLASIQLATTPCSTGAKASLRWRKSTSAIPSVLRGALQAKLERFVRARKSPAETGQGGHLALAGGRPAVPTMPGEDMCSPAGMALP